MCGAAPWSPGSTSPHVPGPEGKKAGSGWPGGAGAAVRHLFLCRGAVREVGAPVPQGRPLGTPFCQGPEALRLLAPQRRHGTPAPLWARLRVCAGLVGGGWPGPCCPCQTEPELLAGGGGHAPQMPACFPWDLGPPACVWCPCSDVETHTGEQRAPWVPLADRYEPAPPAAAAAGLGPLGHTASFSREPLWGSLGGLGSDVPTATCPLASLEGEVPGVQRTVKVHRPWAGAVLSLLGIQAVLRLRLPAPKAVEAASRQAGAGPASWGAAGPSPRSPPSYASGHSPAGLDPEGRAGCRRQGRGELVVGLVLVMASETHFPCAPE